MPLLQLRRTVSHQNNKQASVRRKTLRKCKKQQPLLHLGNCVYFTNFLESALLNKQPVSWRIQLTCSEWSNYPQQKSTVSVTEMGDLFASACCHFRCTHHAITGLEEHDRAAHSPAHCGFQDMRSCDLLLFSSSDHTPSGVTSLQTSEKYPVLLYQTFISRSWVTIRC